MQVTPANRSILCRDKETFSGSGAAASPLGGQLFPAIVLLAIGLRPGSLGLILLSCLLVVVVSLVISWIIAPRSTLRLFVWIFFRLFYRIHIYGRENIPDQGPALLAGNHVSWLDGVLLLFVNRRIVRAMVYEGNFRSRIMQTLVRQWGARRPEDDRPRNSQWPRGVAAGRAGGHVSRRRRDSLRVDAEFQTGHLEDSGRNTGSRDSGLLRRSVGEYL
jgi:hypothetical protein